MIEFFAKTVHSYNIIVWKKVFELNFKLSYIHCTIFRKIFLSYYLFICMYDSRRILHWKKYLHMSLGRNEYYTFYSNNLLNLLIHWIGSGMRWGGPIFIAMYESCIVCFEVWIKGFRFKKKTFLQNSILDFKLSNSTIWS